jgi:hypothetical protein
MAQSAARPHVIADRYLTSPAALAASPFGPVDALDTHSGRGAQVRLVFVDAGWDEGALADAISRWCAIGCSEVCGVLDFGRHADRWYLVLPPSLGLPVERWRALRRPAADDAARLVLAFGRVAERVAGCGFSPDAAVLADIAVGPGPTPFLERPLLSPEGRPAPAGDGQRLLAAVCDAALGGVDPPPGLAAWRERARGAQFAGLGECLDDLERRGATAADRDGGGAEPPGLERLFDDALDLDGPALVGPPPRGRRLAAWAPSLLIALVAVVALLGHLGRSGAQSAPLSDPRPTPVATTPHRPTAAPPAPTAPNGRHSAPANRSTRRHHRRPKRRPRTATAVHAPAPTATTPAPTTATAPPTTTSSSGPTALPAPGGTTLPAP